MNHMAASAFGLKSIVAGKSSVFPFSPRSGRNRYADTSIAFGITAGSFEPSKRSRSASSEETAITASDDWHVSRSNDSKSARLQAEYAAGAKMRWDEFYRTRRRAPGADTQHYDRRIRLGDAHFDLGRTEHSERARSLQPGRRHTGSHRATDLKDYVELTRPESMSHVRANRAKQQPAAQPSNGEAQRNRSTLRQSNASSFPRWRPWHSLTSIECDQIDGAQSRGGTNHGQVAHRGALRRG